MFTTMFLSMWISNTASTAMMVPIVDAIMVELYSQVRKENEYKNLDVAMDQVRNFFIIPKQLEQQDQIML